MARWKLKGKQVITPSNVITDGSVIIQNKKINQITSDDVNCNIEINIEDGIVCSGLINGHDHLIGTYYPKIGKGPYLNWLPWDNDLKSSPVYIERNQIENSDLYLLAAYRALISGSTNVQDHIPHVVQDMFKKNLPIKVIDNYALAHSIGFMALKWGDSIEVEHQKALDKDWPFVTHCSEGSDEETKKNVQTLKEKGAISDHTVLVHGIAFSDDDMDLLAQEGASVVWCCDSNLFMFNKTTRIDKLLARGINVCIGTDSPASGGENLLKEMQRDKAYYEKTYGTELSDKQIVEMVTTNAVKAFRLKDTGLLEEGLCADLTVFRDNGDPYSSVVNANYADIKLVVIDGLPHYGDLEYAELFDALGVEYQETVIAGVEKIIVGDVNGLMRRIRKNVGYKKEFPFMPVEID